LGFLSVVVIMLVNNDALKDTREGNKRQRSAGKVIENQQLPSLLASKKVYQTLFRFASLL
jgi:hypothetical protein